MSRWRDYRQTRPGGAPSVVGDVRILEGVESPQLGNRRDLLAYLPPGWGGPGRRLPVIYMHDGQNLFDAETSYAGEWRVDETMEALAREGIEAIVIGIPNAGTSRIDEYNPFPEPRGGGKAEAYLRFLVETVKPIVDRDLAPSAERANTGILGSSLGGSLSLYAFFAHAGVFGFAGALSPSVNFAGGALLDWVERAPFVAGRVYLDVGDREGESSARAGASPGGRRPYVASVQRMRDLLTRKGYRADVDLLYREERGAGHDEGAWARRLPGALRFLLERG